MNVSEIFIRRPIATSLLMAAIAMFGVVAYRALPVSDLPTVDSPTIQIQAGLPGGDPGIDGRGGRQPDRAAAHDDCGHRLDDLAEQHGQQQRSRCSSTSGARSTARSSTCRRRSPK